jgi:ATP-dependent 26S proteasome regulatory subunit
VLDSALIRPGRVDNRILLRAMSRALARKISTRMYSHVDMDGLDALAEAVVSRHLDGKITPAELQAFVLNHMDRPEAAAEEVES